LKSAREGEFDFSDKLKRLGDAEQAVKKFSRCLFGASPDRASSFRMELLGLVMLDVPKLPQEDSERLLRPTNAAHLRGLQSILIDRRLACLVRELWRLMSQHREALQTPAEWNQRDVVERRSMQAVANCGCRFYRRAHDHCPIPRKKDGKPDGPFDKFMMAVMNPVAAELRKRKKNGRAGSYNWPTLMKYADRARAAPQRPPPQTA
jgi:hypothetical protein